MAEDPAVALVNIFYHCCLEKKFPHVERTGGLLLAFDHDSGRNFAWDKDKQAWIDVKTGESICPTSATSAPEYALVNIFYHCCLEKKFPHVERTGGLLLAFDHGSGRNFAWDKDKQAWVDTKTGECICPTCPGQVKEEKKEVCEIEFGYDYMRAPDESAKSLNGFGGSLFCNVKPSIAIGGDFGALFVPTTDTIGHIADITIDNRSDDLWNLVIPPLIFQSNNGKTQDYVCPRGQELMIAAHESKTVPMFGICLERDKPTANKDVYGEYVVNTGNGNVPANLNWRLSPKAARDLLRIAESKCDAADKLEHDGAFKDFPYHDKQERKNIAIQWSIWSDSRICTITGGQPATKDDFQKVVYKQVEQHGPISRDTKKKIDKGDDAMWNGIELASAKAKDLEKPEQPAEQPPAPTPTPQTH